MAKTVVLIVFVASLLFVSLIAYSFPVFAQNGLGVIKFNQSTSDEFVPGQVVVGLEKPDPNFHANVIARGGQVINTIDQLNAHVIKVPVNSEDVFISSISHNPNVKYAERDVIMRATFTPNDNFFDIQWGMQRIGMETVWQTDQTLGSGVIVAVIDGGVYYNHSDLAGTRILTSLDRDFVDNDYDVLPTQLCNGNLDWHSTFVSGVVGATKNNSIGVAGVGPVDLLLVRVLDCGSGPSSVVALGILYATDNGADVINLSLGSNFASTLIFDAVNTAHENGAIVVASAGNDGSGRDHYPSGFANVISVSATDIGDNLASYSNFGKTIELTAPGGESGSCSTSGTTYIVSTYPPNSYVCAAGTSFSAPHVSGVAALVKAKNPLATNIEIREHLQTTAEDLGKPGWDRKFGYGLVRADIAVSTSIVAPPDPVDNTAPQAPTLFSPTNDATINDNTPTFDWSDITDPSTPVTYELLVDNNTDFFTPEISQTGLSASTFTPTTSLLDGAYNWKVRASDDAGNVGSFSSIFGFTVDTTQPGAGNTLFVGSIAMSGDTKSRGGEVSCKAKAQVTIIDQDGNSVADAIVNGLWSDAFVDTVSGTTNGKGKISFRTSWVGCGTFVFTVDEVIKAGFSFDRTSNSNSITLG